jgi:hypothetical protein
VSQDGTNTTVAVSASNSVAVLAANNLRGRATVFNDGAATVYLSLGTTATTSSHTIQIAPQGYYEVPQGYTGAITHVGSSGTGNLRVTEI